MPEYQRCYSWDRAVIEAFWEDILEAKNSGIRQYFLGTTIVISRTLDRLPHFEIVDGQQRLATLCILMAAMRDVTTQSWKKGTGRNKRCGDGDYLLDRIKDSLCYYDVATKMRYDRVKLGREDQPFFSSHILKGNTTDEQKRNDARTESNKRILNAYLFFCKHIQRSQEVDKGNEWLAQFYKYLTENVYMMSIKTTVDTDAYHVFESVNARGTELSHMQLLKSFFLAAADEADRPHLSSKLAELSSKFKEGEYLRFFRYYWMSKHGLLRKFDLYRKVKQAISLGLKSKDVVDQLDNLSNTYLDVIRVSGNWTDEVRRCLSALRSIGATQVHPLLLATADRFGRESKEFAQMAKASVDFVIRKFVIGGERPGSFESEAGELARKVNASRTDIAEVISELKKNAPDDAAFRRDFAECSIRSQRAAKYILKELERAKRDTRELDVQESVDLEHVLPKNPSEEWTKNLGDVSYEEWVYRIGNLTLIDRGFNRSIQNKGFDLKKKTYQKSKIEITREIDAYDTWGPEQIEDRQKAFARIATKIWTIS
ncbi:MAG: DUF262 domain-containing protein [Candidatus Thorarchaeota archaeon]|nr:DUF262 domain-containing protein [Candidatus Thorarchaeota archaeon]